ncbi:hypothetical protein HDU97_002719 [Phlyctochytrium planicorne]|nr:hypothetical protein HDU97_002719 [Phlyctochytrium planicorne]
MRSLPRALRLVALVLVVILSFSILVRLFSSNDPLDSESRPPSWPAGDGGDKISPSKPKPWPLPPPPKKPDDGDSEKDVAAGSDGKGEGKGKDSGKGSSKPGGGGESSSDADAGDSEIEKPGKAGGEKDQPTLPSKGKDKPAKPAQAESKNTTAPVSITPDEVHPLVSNICPSQVSADSTIWKGDHVDGYSSSLIIEAKNRRDDWQSWLQKEYASKYSLPSAASKSLSSNGLPEFKGQGIVIILSSIIGKRLISESDRTSTNITQDPLAHLFFNLVSLRDRLQCKLPVEVWTFEKELSKELADRISAASTSDRPILVRYADDKRNYVQSNQPPASEYLDLEKAADLERRGGGGNKKKKATTKFETSVSPHQQYEDLSNLIKVSASINSGFQRFLMIEDTVGLLRDPSNLLAAVDSVPSAVTGKQDSFQVKLDARAERVLSQGSKVASRERVAGVFWPALRKISPNSLAWTFIDQPCRNEWEQDTSIAVVDKTRSWKALMLAWYLTSTVTSRQFLHKLASTSIHRLAFLATSTIFHPIQQSPSFAGFILEEDPKEHKERTGKQGAGKEFCGVAVVQSDSMGRPSTMDLARLGGLGEAKTLDLRSFFEGHPPVAVMKKALPTVRMFPWEDFRLPQVAAPKEELKTGGKDLKKGQALKDGESAKKPSKEKDDAESPPKKSYEPDEVAGKGDQKAQKFSVPDISKKNKGVLEGLEKAAEAKDDKRMVEPRAEGSPDLPPSVPKKVENPNPGLSSNDASSLSAPVSLSDWYVNRNSHLPDRIFPDQDELDEGPRPLYSYPFEAKATMQTLIGRPLGGASNGPLGTFDCWDLEGESEFLSLSTDAEDDFGIGGTYLLVSKSVEKIEVEAGSPKPSFPSLEDMGIPASLPRNLFRMLLAKESEAQKLEWEEAESKRRFGSLALSIILLTVLPLSIGVCWLIAYRCFLRGGKDDVEGGGSAFLSRRGDRMRYRVYKTLKGEA